MEKFVLQNAFPIEGGIWRVYRAGHLSQELYAIVRKGDAPTGVGLLTQEEVVRWLKEKLPNAEIAAQAFLLERSWRSGERTFVAFLDSVERLFEHLEYLEELNIPPTDFPETGLQ